MKILIFYANNGNPTTKQLIAGIQDLNSKIQIQYCHDVSELLEAAKTIFTDFCLTLLIVSTRDEIDVLSKSRDILNNKNLIIVLPDDTPDMFLVASKFYPRFIGYQDSTYRTVISVVEKIVKMKHENFFALNETWLDSNYN